MGVLCEWECLRCGHKLLGGTLGKLIIEGKEWSDTKIGDEWVAECSACMEYTETPSTFKVVGGWAGDYKDWNPNGVK